MILMQFQLINEWFSRAIFINQTWWWSPHPCQLTWVLWFSLCSHTSWMPTERQDKLCSVTPSFTSMTRIRSLEFFVPVSYFKCQKYFTTAAVFWGLAGLRCMQISQSNCSSVCLQSLQKWEYINIANASLRGGGYLHFTCPQIWQLKFRSLEFFLSLTWQVLLLSLLQL